MTTRAEAPPLVTYQRPTIIPFSQNTWKLPPITKSCKGNIYTALMTLNLSLKMVETDEANAKKEN